ncbi:MAG TPA: HAMP domain-containing sensor histidine kinase [Streptosporangiaceae bacterium]|nr:HAMP domain-containing sensor histidine kinase [Streptosporangiaceae bacterium]
MSAHERESSGAGHWAAGRWRAASQLSKRTSLRAKLIASLLALVIIALVVISVVGVTFMRTYLIGQADSSLKNGRLQIEAQQAVADSLNGDPCGQAVLGLAGQGYAVWWIPASGTIQQVVQPEPAPAGYMTSCQVTGYGPATSSVKAVEPTLVATNGWTTTLPGQLSGDRWRVTSSTISLTNGTSSITGTMVVGMDVSTVYTTIQQLTGVDIVVSIVILSVLALAGFAVVQTNLRPLVDIEETAGEIAAGHLNLRVPERDPQTEIGRLGRSLNIMLSQIEAAFHAQEESEQAALQSEERMRRFIADASHELRTPLTAIRGFAEYYRQRGGLVRDNGNGNGEAARDQDRLTPDDLERIMGRVEKEAARMGLLVEDLLMLARLDQQRPLARQPVDLLTLAADAVGDARLLAPSRDIDLSVQPGAAFLVIGDEPKLRQVIGNLMSNALTHTPDGTPIRVSISSGVVDPRVSDPTPAVILEVIDHGPGMTPEQASRVFERFYRADQARTRGGTGLGLAIVDALVSAQGGVASVSTAEGQGATFRIALPLAPEALGTQYSDEEPDAADAADVAQPELAESQAEQPHLA